MNPLAIGEPPQVQVFGTSTPFLVCSWVLSTRNENRITSWLSFLTVCSPLLKLTPSFMCLMSLVVSVVNPASCCCQNPKDYWPLGFFVNFEAPYQSQKFFLTRVKPQGFKHCLAFSNQTLRNTITKQATIQSHLCPARFDGLVVRLCVSHTCSRNLVLEAKCLHLPSCNRSPVPCISKQWNLLDPSKAHAGHCLSWESTEILSISMWFVEVVKLIRYRWRKWL